jgi:hypothetical protein
MGRISKTQEGDRGSMNLRSLYYKGDKKMNEWMPDNPYLQPNQWGTLQRKAYGRDITWSEGSTATAKAIRDWLFGACPLGVGDFHDNDRPVTQYPRYACEKCMQEFSKGVDKLV